MNALIIYRSGIAYDEFNKTLKINIIYMPL